MLESAGTVVLVAEIINTVTETDVAVQYTTVGGSAEGMNLTAYHHVLV